jgi:hypothetical protein
VIGQKGDRPWGTRVERAAIHSQHLQEEISALKDMIDKKWCTPIAPVIRPLLDANMTTDAGGKSGGSFLDSFDTITPASFACTPFPEGITEEDSSTMREIGILAGTLEQRKEQIVPHTRMGFGLDNSAVVDIMNKGSRKVHLQRWAVRVYVYCIYTLRIDPIF